MQPQNVETLPQRLAQGLRAFASTFGIEVAFPSRSRSEGSPEVLADASIQSPRDLARLMPGSYFKGEAPPSFAPLQAGLRQLLARPDAAEQLGEIFTQLQAITRMGDTSDSVSYHSIEVAMRVVKDHGLGPRMTNTLMGIVKSEGWSAKAMVALSELQDPQSVNLLFGLLLSSASERSPLSHPHRPEKILSYAIGLLSSLARANNLSTGELSLNFCADDAGLRRSGGWRDQEGSRVFADWVVQGYSSAPQLGQDHLNSFHALLSSESVFPEVYQRIDQIVEQRRGELPQALYVGFKLAYVRNQIEHLLSSCSRVPRVEAQLEALAALSPEAQALHTMVQRVNDQLHSLYPEMDASYWKPRLLPQALALHSAGKDFELVLVPPETRRVLKKSERSQCDPSEAAGDVECIRNEYERIVLNSASLQVVENRSASYSRRHTGSA